jgi:hypothetical protein
MSELIILEPKISDEDAFITAMLCSQKRGALTYEDWIQCKP